MLYSRLLALLLGALFTNFAYAQSSIPLDQFRTPDLETELSQGLSALDFGIAGDTIDNGSGIVSFSHTDVSLPGNSDLPVSFGRFYTMHGVDYFGNTLGGWNIDIPFMTNRVAIGYVSHSLPTAWPSSSCNGDFHSPISATYNSTPPKYWDGARIFSQGSGGELLINTENSPAQVFGNSMPDLTTQSHWKIDCITQPTPGGGNAYTPTAFKATTPQGWTYTFNYAATYLEHAVLISSDGFEECAESGGDELISSSPDCASDWLNGQVNSFYIGKTNIYPTQLTDQHGNWVKYEYSGKNLTRIHSNDGRDITITYSGDETGYGPSKVQTVSANGRVWTYAYGPSGYPNDQTGLLALQRVTQPDGLKWEMDFPRQPNIQVGAANPCSFDPATSNTSYNSPRTFFVKHPSGAKAEFDIKIIEQGFTNIPSSKKPLTFPWTQTQLCNAYDVSASKVHYAVVEKRLTAHGAPASKWMYEFEQDEGIRNYPAAISLQDLRKTIVIDPKGHKTEYFYDRRFDSFTKGLLIKSVEFNEDTALRTTKYEYEILPEYGKSNLPGNCRGAVFGTGGCTVLSPPANNPNQDPWVAQRPVKKTTVSIIGDIYTSEQSYNSNMASASFSFGRPVQTQSYSNRWNSRAPRVTDIVYEHNKAKWILGLTKQTTQNGRVMTEASYSNGQLTEQKEHGEVVYSVSYYTSGAQNGQIKYVDDAIGRRTKAFNWKRGIPQHIKRADGTDIYTTVDDNGWVTSSTDAMGYTTNYTRDAMGRLTQYNPTGAWDDTIVNYAFGNNTVKTVTKGSAKTTITYDGMYRPVLEETRDLATSWVSYVNMEYDALGRVAFKSQPSTSQYEDEGTTYSYDALGRLKNTVETASGATTTHRYFSGHRHRITQPSGDWTDYYSYGYDGPDSKDYSHIYNYGDGVYHRRTILYKNIWGRITRLRQFGNLNGHGGDKSQYFHYDAQQRLCRHYVPEHGATKYQYDDAGQMTAYAKGQSNSGCGAVPSVPEKVSMTYDDMGRVTLTDFTDSDTPDIARTYDDNGNVLTVNRGTGGAAVNWTYAYNDINLLTSESLSVDGLSFNSAYQYNNSGHMTLRTMPSGRTLTYLPDGLGRTRVVYNNGAWMVDNVSWHPNGSVAAMRHRNGQMFTQTLNNRLLPERLLSVKGADIAIDQTLTYDVNGRVSSILDGAITGNSRTYDYDALGQLTFAAGPWGMGSYDYDSLGNLRSKTLGARTVDLAYDITRNRVSQSVDSGPSGTRAIAYDSRGNVTSLGNLAMTYDMSDQPTIVTGTADGVGAANGNYRYDGNLKRVVSVVNGKTIYNVYDASGALIHVDADTDNKVTDYVTGPMGTFARITNGGTVTYLHPDHLGSAQSGTTASGTVAWTEQYTPFGEELQSPAANDNLAGFTGHIKDKATGLNYMQARYYDPVIGRFLSIDPVTFMDTGDPVQFNRYAYGNNDPINMIDPDGRVALNPASGAAVGCAVTGPACPAGATVGAVVGAVALGVTALVVANEISDNAGTGANNEKADPVDGVLEGATPGEKTKGRTKNYDKPGGQAQAEEDFGGLVEPGSIEERDNGTTTGTMNDGSGRSVNVRPNSTDGRPTLEIQEGKNKTKIRYDE